MTLRYDGYFVMIILPVMAEEVKSEPDGEHG